MLGFEYTDLSYLNKEGTKCEDKVFFFGNPGRPKEEVYKIVYNLAGEIAGNKSNLINIDRIIEFTGLNDILTYGAQVKMSLGDKVEGKPDHVLNKKISFVKEIINEIAINYLKYVNILMWIDNYDYITNKKKIVLTAEQIQEIDINQHFDGEQKERAKKNLLKKKIEKSKEARWREGGISFDTALNFCKNIANEMIGYYTLMIDLKFDPSILGKKMNNDFNDVINEYKEKTGYIQKTKGKSKQ